jgi:hypothetical protein
MYPYVLEVITEQRIEELRNSRASLIESPETGSSRSHSANGPIGKAKSRVGNWMVTTGSKLANDGAGSPLRLHSQVTNSVGATL